MLINFTVLFSIVTGPLHFHCFLVSIDWLSGRLLDPIFSIFPVICRLGYLITVHSITGYFKIWHDFYFHCTCISLPNIGNQFPWLLIISIGIWKNISVNSYMHSDQKCIYLIFLLPHSHFSSLAPFLHLLHLFLFLKIHLSERAFQPSLCSLH